MSRIKVKNFGPIKSGAAFNDGWIDIKKVTVFIGNQGSGKSTIAKLISTLSWIEKVLVRGDYEEKKFTTYERFKKIYCAYHRIENYFAASTEIEYVGDAYKMNYKGGKFTISKTEQKANYLLPKIMYVPAERNFISTVKNIKQLKFSSDSLVEFVTEFDNAKKELKETVNLPINNTDLEYDRLNDLISIKGKDYKIRLTEASSGFQSLIPLFIVTRYLSNLINTKSEDRSSEELKRFKEGVKTIWNDKTLTEEQRRAALSVLSSKFNISAFINIVEEPEQNLYPTSQKNVLNSLLKFNNANKGNRLIMTTHSPFIINYLTLAVKTAEVNQRIKSEDLRRRLDLIYPIESTINADDLAIYQMKDDGTIAKLEDYEGLPSDDNFLNNELAEGNNVFTELLEIEDLCQ